MIVMKVWVNTALLKVVLKGFNTGNYIIIETVKAMKVVAQKIDSKGEL